MIDSEPRVASVLSEWRVVINKGSDDGVESNDRFLIYGLGDEIIDPETGQSLGALEIVRGRAKVVHLQARLTTLESIMVKNVPGVRKTIKRTNSLTMNLAGLGGREEIEDGPRTEDVPLEDPNIGDFARPI